MLFLILVLIVLWCAITGGVEKITSPYDFYKFTQVKTPPKTFKGICIVETDENSDLPVWKWKDSYSYAVAGEFVPFARFHTPRARLNQVFYDLMSWTPTFENTPFVVNKLPHKLTINGQHVVFSYEERSTICVDYFQDDVRMVCKRRGKPSHWEVYQKILPQIPKTADYDAVQDMLWKVSYSCTEISPEVTTGIIEWASKFVHVTSMLDMSAGRGSRLTAAIASPYITRYLGVDPNTMSHEWYVTQARYWCDVYNNSPSFAGIKNPANFTVLPSGFVEAKIPYEFYDIMFSSPPYFDLEVYSSDAQQSVASNKNLEAWLKNFMFVSMDKIIAHLRMGGLMCININVSMVHEDDWVTPLLRYARGCEYLGCVASYKQGKSDIQPTWIWRKTPPPLSFIPPITDILKYMKVTELSNKEFNQKLLKGTRSGKKNLELYTTKKPLSELATVKRGIWSISDSHVTMAWSPNFIPLGLWYMDPPPRTATKVNWDVLDRPWSTKYYQECTFNSKNVILMVRSPEIAGLEFFTDPVTIICRKRDGESPWNLWMDGNCPEFLKAADEVTLARQEAYTGLMNWFFFNKILCVASSNTHTVALIEFLRTMYPCTRIWIPENNIFNKMMYGVVLTGFEYLQVDELNATRAERTETILRWCEATNWNVSVGKTAPQKKYNLILYSPTFFELQRPSDDAGEDFLNYTRLDTWCAHIVENISTFVETLEPEGVLCFITHLDFFGGQLKPWTAKAKLLGVIGIYKNTLMHVFVFQRI